MTRELPDREGTISTVTELLAKEFRGIHDIASVARRGHEAYAHFEDVPIKHYIPALVERSAREQLRQGARDQVRMAPASDTDAEGAATDG